MLESCEVPATARVKGTDNGRAEGPEHAEFDWMSDYVTDASTSRVVVTCQSHALRTSLATLVAADFNEYGYNIIDRTRVLLVELQYQTVSKWVEAD